jgi:hypothetical protein
VLCSAGAGLQQPSLKASRIIPNTLKERVFFTQANSTPAQNTLPHCARENVRELAGAKARPDAVGSMLKFEV